MIAGQSIRGKEEQRGACAVDVTTVIFPSGPPPSHGHGHHKDWQASLR